MSDQKKDTTESHEQKKIPLTVIRGLPFPTPFFSADNIEKVLCFKPSDTDIFVTTYPKCGTTWMQFIVWEILHKGAVPPSPNQMMFRDFPFLEFYGVDNLEAMPPPRTMKTHLPFNLQPYNPKSKYIYVVRNPWDCCVSYYYHHKMEPGMEDLTFDEYFELFVTGQVGWGDFFDHVLSWFEHRNDPNVLFLTYESMKKDKKKTILSVAKFLGDSFFDDVSKEEVLMNCLKHTDFKYMKEIGMFFPKNLNPDVSDIKEMVKELSVIDKRTATPEDLEEGNLTEVNFFRQGEVGDWKNHLSPDQVKKFIEYMSKKLKHTEMENFWPPLLEETSL